MSSRSAARQHNLLSRAVFRYMSCSTWQQPCHDTGGVKRIARSTVMKKTELEALIFYTSHSKGYDEDDLRKDIESQNRHREPR